MERDSMGYISAQDSLSYFQVVVRDDRIGRVYEEVL